jgi:hypothetical protein
LKTAGGMAMAADLKLDEADLDWATLNRHARGAT